MSNLNEFIVFTNELQDQFTWLDVSEWWHAVSFQGKGSCFSVPDSKTSISNWLRIINNTNSRGLVTFRNILTHVIEDPTPLLDPRLKHLALQVKTIIDGSSFSKLFQE